jgi:hypothetical protein
VVENRVFHHCAEIVLRRSAFLMTIRLYKRDLHVYWILGNSEIEIGVLRSDHPHQALKPTPVTSITDIVTCPTYSAFVGYSHESPPLFRNW